MAIKKNAAKADIGPKKQVKATFAECTAENPLKCKYHGLKSFDNLINQCLAKHGMTAAFVTDKVDDGYELRFSPDTIFGKAMEDILNALHEKGLNLTFKGTHPETGALVYKAQENDNGITYETPANEAELEDADTISSADAPNNKTMSEELSNVDDLDVDNELSSDLLDNFDELDVVTAEATEDLEAELLGNSDYNEVLQELSEGENTIPELADEDVKKLVALNGVTESKFEELSGLMDSYKSIITTGKNPSGNELTRGQKRWWNDLIAKASSANEDELPALKVLKETMKGIGALKESDAPNNAAQEEVHGQPFADEEFKEALKNYYDATGHDGDSITDVDLKIWKAAVLHGTTVAGEPLVEENQKLLQEWETQLGDDSPISKAIKETLAKLNSDKDGKKTNKSATYLEGGDATDDGLTTEDIVDFFKKCGYRAEGVMVTEENLAAQKEALETGKWLGKPLTKSNKNWYAKLAKKVPNHKVANAINKMLSADKKTHKAKKKVEVKEELAEALSGNVETVVSEGMLKPLEHDESKFPKNITQDELDEAIKKGKKLGGHGGLGTRLVEIDGKNYVCKAATGTGASVIRNGYNADMAYRAGGVYAPDAKLYDFGDGKIYKLSEFIHGKRLIDVWKDADETMRDGIRKELLKGYPLDALFSNYDVLGTSPEDSITVTIQGADGKPQKTHVAFNNIMMGDDGHAYRVDNDGAFAMTGTGGVKSSGGGGYITKVEAEKWGNWEDRQWIDDFRTLRRNEKNMGIFDRYSTADIFLSAANIDIGSVVSTLPKGIQKALDKPASEMKEMAEYAKGTRLAGYPPSRDYTWKDSNGNQQTVKVDPVSIALDSIYEANKQGARPFLQKKISWLDTGWLSGSGGDAGYVPKVFLKPEPKEPKPPAAGTDLANEVLAGIKTINYHAKQGNANVNKSKIDKALAVKPMVEILVEAGYDKAKGILEAIGKVEESIKNGHGKEITFDTSDGFFDAAGLSIVMGDKEKSLFDNANVDKHKKWEKEHKTWEDEKKEHDRKEQEKAKRAGAAPTKSFQEFEDDLITAMIDTDGIKHGGGNPDVNHSSKNSQKDSSFFLESCKKKVRQYAMMGIPLDQMFFENDDPVFYNGHIENGGYHVSGGDGKENFYAAVQFYQDNPEQFRKDMESYARHKGMMALVHMNMDNEAIDRETGTVFVIRGEHPQAWGKNGKGAPNFSVPTIIKPWAIDSSTSACINETGHFGKKAVAWKLPIWRVTDNFMIGNGSEQEICINPINIPYPAMYFPNPGSGDSACKKCQEIYSNAKEVKAVDKKLGKEV